jgi:hypothetical protein
MTSEKILGSQVGHLLSNLSRHGGQHLTEVETDLVQIGFLLGEAIEKLNASFMAIHDGIAEQQKTVDLLLASPASVPEALEKLKAGREEIGRHLNAAVTGLQFQDMTRQLIGRTEKLVVGLRQVIEGLANGGSALAEGNADEIVAALNGINQVLEEQSVKLESALWKTVCQTHMESGDVELF